MGTETMSTTWQQTTPLVMVVLTASTEPLQHIGENKTGITIVET